MKIYMNELPGSDLVLFHVVGSGKSDVLSKTEAISRGINEIRRGNQVSGAASVVKAVQLKGQKSLQFDLILT